MHDGGAGITVSEDLIAYYSYKSEIGKTTTKDWYMTNELTLDALVFTTDGHSLGRVKKIEPSAFLVNAPKAFDYWLEKNLVTTATAERVDISIIQADLGAYKMDKPFDHNGFKESHPASLDPSNVQAQAIARGGRSRL